MLVAVTRPIACPSRARPEHTPNTHVTLPPQPRMQPSRNYFECNINETIVREVADAIVKSGLRDAGYIYVNIGGGAFLSLQLPEPWPLLNP